MTRHLFATAALGLLMTGAALAAEKSGDAKRARVHYAKLASVTKGVNAGREELLRAREMVARGR